MFLVTCFIDFCSNDCHAKDIQYHGHCEKSRPQTLNKDMDTTSIAVYSLSIIGDTVPSPWPHPLSCPRPLISLQSPRTWIIL